MRVAIRHPEDSNAIRDALCKMQVYTLAEETNMEVIRTFFELYQDMILAWKSVPVHVAERRQWIDSEERVCGLLRPDSPGTALAVSKQGLWECVQNCGQLTGSLELTRARLILDAEDRLISETRIDNIIEDTWK